MDTDVEFVAVDFPQTNRLTVHIRAAVAEHEREMISQRTKAALAAAKARGTVLGTDNLTDAARRLGTAKSAEMRRRKAQERAADIMPMIETIRVGGVTTLSGIANALNKNGIPTPRGGAWQGVQVQRVMTQAA